MTNAAEIITEYGPLAVGVDPPTRTWANSNGTYIAGRAYLDEADAMAAAMEAKWGCGRLRLLVGPELREKFDRQRYLLNRAIWHGSLDDVRREAPRMVTAYRALDRAAEAAGAKPLDLDVWEVCLSDGSVAAIVQDTHSAWKASPDGRPVNVYTLEEIARLLEGYPEIVKAKARFPGARVERVAKTVSDPLDALDGSSREIDAPFIDDEIPF